MLQQFSESQLHLSAHGLYSLPVPAGTVIQGRNGVLWLTEAESGDILLHPGERYTTRGNGAVLVESQGDAYFSIRLPAPSNAMATISSRAQQLSHAIRRLLQRLIASKPAAVASSCRSGVQSCTI